MRSLVSMSENKERTNRVLWQIFDITWVPKCAGNKITISHNCIFSQLNTFHLGGAKMTSGKQHKINCTGEYEFVWVFLWKELSIASVSLLEKLELFCREKTDAITSTRSNFQVFPAAILCQGAGRLQSLLHLRHVLEWEVHIPAQLLTGSESTILPAKFSCAICISRLSFALKSPPN